MKFNKTLNNKFKRCIISNKIINNNHEIIIKDYALDYVLKNYDIREIYNIYEDSRK